jgi:hypothetical protein
MKKSTILLVYIVCNFYATRVFAASNFPAHLQESHSISPQTPESHKYCFDDTYGSTGMKLELTLYNNGTAKLEFKRNGTLQRSGVGKWNEVSGISEGYGENGIVYLRLTTGATLKFEALKNAMRKTYMLLDSRENQYMECF